jgi:glycerol transport system ATP-binding protein
VAAVLFDEPLTVIDPQLKWLLRRKLKQIHQQLRLSLIYVTHDQTEALTFADQTVVMSQGEVAQIGSAQELFETPAQRFVGEFIGTPGMNFLACSWRNGAVLVAGSALRTSSERAPLADSSLALGIRPEYVELADSAAQNNVPARILSVRDEGLHTMIELDVQSQRVWAKARNLRRPPALGPAFVHFPVERCALFADGRRVK